MEGLTVKKKILIALYAYKPFENANTNVFLPLITELEKDYEVHIVSSNVNGLANRRDTFGNTHVYRYETGGKIKETLLRLFFIDPHKVRKGVKKILVPIGHLFSALLFRLRILRHNEFDILKNLILKNDYCFIISTCARFVSCLNVLMLKKKGYLKCPWIVYFMDPFARYIENLESKKYLTQELEIYENANLILVTEEIYEQNKQDVFSKFLYKTRAARFCNFIIPKVQTNSVTRLRKKDKAINCVYAGSLINDEIRNPRYLFEIINSLHGTYLFHMVLYKIPKDRLTRYKKMITDTTKVVWYDTLSLDETKKIITDADILINIGNKVVNQTPSKVFDYITTRKPIVNITSIAKDTSAKYLKNYPLCLNIYEDYKKVEENAQAFDCFCKSVEGKSVSIDHLKQYYAPYDQKNAVNQIMLDISEILN